MRAQKRKEKMGTISQLSAVTANPRLRERQWHNENAQTGAGSVASWGRARLARAKNGHANLQHGSGGRDGPQLTSRRPHCLNHCRTHTNHFRVVGPRGPSNMKPARSTAHRLCFTRTFREGRRPTGYNPRPPGRRIWTVTSLKILKNSR